MKKIFLFFLLIVCKNAFSQTLTEINFTNLVPSMGGHLTGQFTGVANSADGSLVFVASHAGGVYRSTDGGLNFTHLDNFPASGVVCIRYIEKSTPLLIVAVEDWWLASSRSSYAWMSTDQGNTWTKSIMPAVPREYTASGREGLQGYDIDYNPVSDIIYLATDFGLLQSTDGGLSFIYRETPAEMAAEYKRNPAVFTVKWIKENKVCMAGSAGFFNSPDGGRTWERNNFPATATPSTARGKSTISFVPSTEIIVTSTSDFPNEYYSFSSSLGRSWTTFSGPPAGSGGCGGWPYLKCKRKSTAGGPDSCVIYASNKCNFFRKAFRIRPDNTVDFSNTAAWVMLERGLHSDSHEITFLNERSGNDRPYLITTDGGLHKSTGIFDYPLTSGPHRGLNALLIYDMAGQLVRSASRRYNHTLYYGTQDNNLGYWDEALGRAQVSHPDVPAEGRGLETGRYGGQITYTAGSPYFIYQAGIRYSGITGFRNCPNNIWWPFYLADNCYVQLGAPPGAEPGTVGLYITNTNGVSWSLIYSKTSESPGLPKVARVAANTAVIFMPVHDESNNQIFVKIVADLTALTATAFMPDFTEFTGFGFQQYEIPVFAVNPANPDHIIAPDMGSSTIKQSVNGGNSWTEIAGLTSRITNGGEYRFRNEYNGSFINSIGFSPSGQTITIGTAQNGIFCSANGGTSWDKITGSETMKNICQPYFKPVISGDAYEDIYFPTMGRGIWKLQMPNRPIFVLPDDILYWKHYLRLPRDFGIIRNPSQVRPFDRPAARFDEFVFFDPGSLKTINNTQNGLTVLLKTNAELYSRKAGLLKAGYLDLPALQFQKISNANDTQYEFDTKSGEKVVGVAVANKKIEALIMTQEYPPYFVPAKQWLASIAKSTPMYDAKKLDAFKNRFFISDGKVFQSSFPPGKNLQLVCCHLDNRNGTVKEWSVFLNKQLWSSFVAGNQQNCITVPLKTANLPLGKYEIEISPKGEKELTGKTYFEIRPQDKK